MSAAISFSTSPYRMRIAFLTPVTPARERPSRTSGREAWRSCSRRWEGSFIVAVILSFAKLAGGFLGTDDSFARLVSLACHDLRTPLATVSGFASTLERLEQLDEPADRYVEMILAGAKQMAELLEDLALVARIEDGRYEAQLVDGDTRELVEAAAARLGERGTAGGEGAVVRIDREPTERALAALALGAARHGGVDTVELRAERAAIAIGPVTRET